jgi:glyceraldehyde 3-phosphate dehydrogenase
MEKKYSIGINGLGRIGRVLLKTCIKKGGVDVVLINELADNKTIAHLLKYDSIYGVFDGDIEHNEDGIFINKKFIPITHHKDINNILWGNYQAYTVMECTGLFLTTDDAKVHIKNGAKKVIFSAPPKDNTIKTVVLGVNDNLLTADDVIVSNASCTTNSAAPMLKILNDLWQVESAFITTVHSYTGDQRLTDSPHKDLRRARAAALSIIPTTTGAAKALTKIFPNLEGKLGGSGIRVPVPNGSLTDITAIVKQDITAEEINKAFYKAAQNELTGILEYTDDPIVSHDIVGNGYSVIFDSLLTSVVGKMVKVVGWYDNEMGYSCRLYDLIIRLNSF